MFAPCAVSSTSTRSPSARVRSTGITALAPSGTAAPVEIRTAVPGRTGCSAGCPARDSPISSSAAAGPATRAKPSMAEESKGGTSIALVTSSASTRPAAAASSTAWSPSGRTDSRTSRRASSIEISTRESSHCVR